MLSQDAFKIFEQAIVDYHKYDDTDHPMENPYKDGSIEYVMYEKNWIDTVQWHYEDIVRDPEIDPKAGLELKRKIDKSNQHRTNVVEKVDDYYIELLKNADRKPDARLNTESPGWVVDRLSILALKIYHMQEEVNRKDATIDHKKKCQLKLDVLLEQKEDLFTSFNQLIEDVKAGIRYTKVYRQMKMYNDESLNPVLYTNKK